MLRAARRAVMNGSLFTGAGHRPARGSARINIKEDEARTVGQSSHATVAACFPNLPVLRNYASTRGGLTRWRRLERSNCSMMSPGVPCEVRGRQADCPPPHLLLFFDT